MESRRIAYLSNTGDCISFTCGNRRIRFRGPYSLVRFERVLFWEKGYLVVHARYLHEEEPVEDYIDLIPILRDLYIDAEQFLEPIQSVEVKYV